MNAKEFRSGLMRRLISKCFISVTIATILYLILIAIVWVGGYYFIDWQPGLFYVLANIARNLYFLIIPGGWLVIVLIIILFYWRKTVGYIEEITIASRQLIQSDDNDIQLSEELQYIQDRMNEIKRTARKNERDAKEAERRKNDLVVNLAHDIRTPLASVIGYLSILSEVPDLPLDQKIKYTNITLEKTFRLEHLIEEFFEITRFNLSSIILNKTSINLPLMLQQMADEFYPLLLPKSNSITVNSSDNLHLFGDPDKLSRVLNNILKNAVTYSDEGSEITIQANEEDGNVIIQISNQGDPIPPHQLDTIFERFYRLDSSRSSQTGGAGLGLAIAKEIVNAHDGTICARCENRMTTFTISLPLQNSK